MSLQSALTANLPVKATSGISPGVPLVPRRRRGARDDPGEDGYAVGAISVVPGTVRAVPTEVRVRVSGPAGRLAGMAAESLFIVVDGTGAQQPGRVRLPVIAPPGIAARAEPDSVNLVRRNARG